MGGWEDGGDGGRGIQITSHCMPAYQILWHVLWNKNHRYFRHLSLVFVWYILEAGTESSNLNIIRKVIAAHSIRSKHYPNNVRHLEIRFKHTMLLGLLPVCHTYQLTLSLMSNFLSDHHNSLPSLKTGRYNPISTLTHW